MTRSTTCVLFLLAAACALPASAQNCSLTPGSVGLGNYCADASRNEQKVAVTAQANTSAIGSTQGAIRAKENGLGPTQTGVPGQVQRWTIFPTDAKLAVTFERWASAAGMKLIWDAQQHVMLSSSDTFEGTLEQALARVLSSSAIRKSSYPLEACVYPNNPPVLRITRLGDQKECQQ